MSTKQINDISVDDLIDISLEDLADKPSIELYPAGTHKVTCNLDPVKDKKGAFVFKMDYIEAVELANSGDTAPAPGDVNTVFINLKKKDGGPSEYGQGVLKSILVPMSEHFGKDKKVGELMAEIKDLECMVTTKVNKGKKDYADQIEIVQLAVI